jgi:hypothetical protein
MNTPAPATAPGCSGRIELVPVHGSLTPMRLLRIPEPFDHPEFLFEPKLDGSGRWPTSAAIAAS